MDNTFQIPDKQTLTDVDRASDLFLVYDSSAQELKNTTVNYMLDLTSHPVGITDTQTLTNKTLTNPTIASGTLSGTFTGTYTLGGTPTFPSTVVTTTGTQTLTNKTLSGPTITNATISNPTLTVDSINEFTLNNGVTIDGVLLKDSKMNGSYITDGTVSATQLATNAVTTTKITDGSVTTAKVTDSGAGLTYSATQSIANATIQAVLFNTESFDTDNYHSTVSNTSRITVPTAGKYLFCANVMYASNATGVRHTFFCRNGVTSGRYGIAGTTATNGDSTGHSISYIFNLSANDYIEVYVYQSSGGALNLQGDASFAGATSFEVTRLGT